MALNMLRYNMFSLALVAAAFGQAVPTITNVTNAAIPELDLPPATISLAPRSMATIFGTNLADTIASSVSPWSNTLGGTEIHLADDSCFDSSCDLVAPLIYVSPTQVNFLVPDDRSASCHQSPTTCQTSAAYRIVFVRDGQRIDNQTYISGGPGRLIITSAAGNTNFQVGQGGDGDVVFQVGYDCLYSYSLLDPASCGLSWSQGQYREPLGAVTDAISGQLVSSKAPVHQGQLITLWMTGLYSGVTLNTKTGLMTANTITPIGFGVAQLGQDRMNTLECPSLQCAGGFGFVGAFMTPLPLWAGESSQFVGLDQVNVAFPTCANAPVATTEKRYDAFITYNTFDTNGIAVSALRIYVPFVVRANDPGCQWAIDTNTTLASNVNPSVSGQAVILTATVSPSAATGTVTFFDGTTQLGSALLTNGVAIISTAGLSTGTHSITAVYIGNNTYGSSWSAANVQTVTPAAPSLSITYSPSTVAAGQTVTFTVSLSNAQATGTITLFVDTATVGVSIITNGQVTFSTSLSAGSHTITASYSGNSTLNSTFTSITINATVTLIPTSIIIESSASPATYQAPNNTCVPASPSCEAIPTYATFKATVSPIFPSEDASTIVDFMATTGDGASNYPIQCNRSPVYIVEGVATCAVNGGLSTGTSAVSAVFNGNNTYLGSTSAPINQVIDMPLYSYPNPATVGQAVSLTVVTGWPWSADGIVTFYDGANVIGSGIVSPDTDQFSEFNGSNLATLQTSSLGVGNHSISAIYTPTPGVVVATSQVVIQTVNGN